MKARSSPDEDTASLKTRAKNGSDLTVKNKSKSSVGWWIFNFIMFTGIVVFFGYLLIQSCAGSTPF